jgi:hypothetical protein
MSSDFHHGLIKQGRIPMEDMLKDIRDWDLKEVQVKPAGVTYSPTRLFLAGLCAFFFVQGAVFGAAVVVLVYALR